MEINHVTAGVTAALLLGATPVLAEDWDVLFRDLTSTNAKDKRSAQLKMSALGVIRSFGPDTIRPLQGRINELKVATSNKELAANARAMLQGITQ